MGDADRRIVLVAGTADTKGAELAYVRGIIRGEGLPAIVLDLSTRPGMRDAEVSSDAIAACHPDGAAAVFVEDRGRAVTAMAAAFERYLRGREHVAGIIGLGGSGGTALITLAMRALPVGVPKLMVSTVASGNVAPFVGASDIAMMYSVTDLAGLNRISRVVLANAARAIAGMARVSGAEAAPDSPACDKPALGLTMFGVTTPCVNAVVERLRGEYDCLVFHATGTGGQSLEKLAGSGLLAGALDVTTTEVCDFLIGGVFACDETRLDVFASGRIPYVGSCGALDMVNFGAIETVPARYRDRMLHVHNPQVTLMRTSDEECARLGRWIGGKLNACEGDVRFLLPRRGVSALDTPGMAFFDSRADAALFEALHETVRQTERRKLVDLDLHINDPAFASALADAFREIARR